MIANLRARLVAMAFGLMATAPIAIAIAPNVARAEPAIGVGPPVAAAPSLAPPSLTPQSTSPVAPASTAEVGRDLPTLPARPLHVPDAPAEFLTQTHGFLTIVYHPSLHDSVATLVAEADSVRAALGAALGQRVLDSVEVRVARTPEEMATLAPVGAPPPSYASGVAYGPLRLVLLSRKAPDSFDAVSLDEVFRHELAHVALFDATAGRPVPRWLHEGFAIWASDENGMKRIQTLWSAQVQGTMLPLSQLDAFPDDAFTVRVAYAESADFVRFLLRESDRFRFSAMIARLRAGEPFERAASDAYGIDLRQLEHQWREDVSRRYLTFPLIIGSGAGWAIAAVLLVVAFRRRRRRSALILERWAREEAVEDARASAEDARVEAIRAAAARAEAEHGERARLLLVEQGAGHVVYIVEQRAVPQVEHDGEKHTLH